MKLFVFKLFALFVVSLQFVCCKDFIPSGYTLTLPQVPQAWLELLGEPCWRLEWLDKDGKRRGLSVLSEEAEKIEVDIPLTWANPVTAFPYWSEHNLSAGLFKPAGAIYPFDVSEDRLCLSWEAGADSVFYWELARAYGIADNNKNKANIPANFDWQRFRELFTAEMLNEAVCKDRWLVDWRSAAEKTAGSDFDRRRFIPQAAENVTIPLDGLADAECLWYGASPFASPLLFEEGGGAVFPVYSGVNVWVSAEGILRVSGKTWVFAEF